MTKFLSSYKKLSDCLCYKLIQYRRMHEILESVLIACIATLQVRGTDYKTADGTCVRDYIDVTDLVDAHVKALEKAESGKVGIYNVGTGKGRLTIHNTVL